MQLRDARLCLDCEEVHDASHCPACASESFAFITRWVPAAERRAKPRPVEPRDPYEFDTYRQMLVPGARPEPNWSLVKRGAVGLAVFGVAGWMWNRKRKTRGEGRPPDGEEPRE